VTSIKPGGVTVGELFATEHFELEILAGSGGLDRNVSWTHVSEVPHPELWIDGGELLIANGLGFPADIDGQARFIVALDEKRAAGLALGVLGPDVRPQTLELADRLAFPLLRVPKQIPFLSIARLVADLNQDHSQRRMATHIRLFDTLRGGCDPAQAASFIAKLEEISGYQLFLLAPSGLPLLHQLKEAPPWIVEHIEGPEEELERQSYSLPGGHAAPVPLGPRTAGFLVALERPEADPAGIGAVRHMATIAALLISNLYRERELERRRGAELLGQLLVTADPNQVERLLHGTGLHAGPICIASLRGADDVVDELHHRLHDFGLPHLLLGAEDDCYLAMEDVPESLEAIINDLDLVAGVSAAFSPSANWALSRMEADRALARVLADGAGAGSLSRYELADSPLEWLRADPRALQALSDTVLQPIAEYDETNGSTLLESLRIYLENDRRLAVAADALFVHKHTLAYRLKRIEELTGRRLGRMDDLCVIWLALKAAEAARGSVPGPASSVALNQRQG